MSERWPRILDLFCGAGGGRKPPLGAAYFDRSMMQDNAGNKMKAMPAPLTETQQLERDIRATIHTVLEFADVSPWERAEAGTSLATRLLMQLLRERGFVETPDGAA